MIVVVTICFKTRGPARAWTSGRDVDMGYSLYSRTAADPVHEAWSEMDPEVGQLHLWKTGFIHQMDLVFHLLL